MSALDDLTAAAGAGSAPENMGVECVERVGAASAPEEEPPRKRARNADEPSLRRRVLDYKMAKLKNLRERVMEQLSELFYLQGGGNMMDYATWRKRPPAPALVAFLEARGLPELEALPATPPPAPHDEMVAAAKQEAYVAGRVAELARAGLWTERRLPRVLEPPRPKSHWDYLLEEMSWLAQDFAHERKWKKQAAKKCARAVQKHFQDKAMAAQKAEKAQELQLRKIAAFAAKEIRTFWSNVEKLVEWKRVRRVERARKEALEEQLSYIVDRSEKYSRQLAANLHRPAPADTPPSDEEFEPRGPSDDDEETIADAERTHTDTAAEIAALHRESRLDLCAILPPGYTPKAAGSDYSSAGEDSADDETTIAEQEKAERTDHAAEIADLEADAEMSVEELRKKYSGAPPSPPPGDNATESQSDTDSDSDSEEESTESESGRSSCASQRLEALVDEKEEVKQQTPAEAESSERRVEAAAELAASIQPRGTTLELAEAGTVAPSLLRGSLREYQLVGLHWLATMHSRGLNGILADEMGLGKTIQTIALLAHLALSGDWGPHLVIAPTSVVLNWEMEFKKWCPAFKILTYYGTIKERKLKRVGWTKPNSFHVCITSYKLVVQDHQSFRRKRWKYLILDEAQNIKNFKSQRWQMLLNFQTDRRLLLTGTPLQNSLLELWSLMHFLMPAVFASHTEFREWFTPLAGAAEAAAGGGGADADPALVRRLHAVLRPFLLRRLKADVERQMPRKYEHVLLCRLAKRQRALYDDFMSRAKTRESLASGNLLSVINVLMQLRKVCNHPDLFEPRPVQSPLYLEPIQARIPSLLLLPSVLEREELSARLGGELASLEMSEAGAFAAHRARHLAPPRRLIEELPTKPLPPPAPKPPPARMRLHLRLVARAPHPTATRPPPPPLPPLTQPELDKESSPTPVDPDVKQSETSAAAARLLARRCSTAKRNAAVNERRCWRLPLYGKDLRDAVQASPPVPPPPLAPPDLAALLRIHNDAIEQFSVCWASARAPAPVLVTGGGAREWKRVTRIVEATAEKIARPLLALLHAPASRQSVAFPHPRLLQYDCGKLQTLAVLLRRLKSGGHRVLIFTQMTRVLDVLEGFLSLHGHAYLRLDGATRVDRRQPLVDRFNADPRLFAFILSTRSGGVGLNLTGADSVVFYDSDWNPTMDAQAQDRCHRIGQTRDVHVYRLVTAATVEENILRKAEQKRALGHLAIEDGHFTTSYLRADNLAELFGTATTNAQPAELESALLACEDEADAAAARAAKAETQKDLAEFDETVPLDDENAPNVSVVEKEESGDCEVLALMKQLSPVEAYAMRLVESGSAEAEKAALDDMRRQLKSWEQRRQELRESTPPPPPATPPIAELTYSGEEARIQVRPKRRRVPPPPVPPATPPPSPPPPAPPPNPPAPRTRSRGTVQIDLWTLDDSGNASSPTNGNSTRKRAHPLRNGTLDAWLATTNDNK